MGADHPSIHDPSNMIGAYNQYNLQEPKKVVVACILEGGIGVSESRQGWQRNFQIHTQWKITTGWVIISTSD